MVTGVEAAGIVLAILPLVVNQLDVYVQGLETIKSFRTRRYRRELESYLTRLGTQRAILLNTLEQSLEGVVDDEDEISELISNPRGSLWKEAAFQARLRKKLDRDYIAFVRTMSELSTLLEDLYSKLGLDFEKPTKIPWDDTNTVDREIKKFKNIFSKSVYAELLGKIENANGCLKALIEQSHHREESRKKRRISKRPLMRYKSARKHATRLYSTVILGQCWKCPYKDQHSVHLRIESDTLDDGDEHGLDPALPKFRMVFSSKTAHGLPKPLWRWQEVDTIPVIVRPPIPTSDSTKAASQSNPKPKVQFATVTSIIENLPWPEPQDLPPNPPILDMCSALCTIIDHDRRELIGSILDESDASHRYNMYSVRNSAGDLETQSLEDLLASSYTVGRHMTRGGFVFSRRDRLFLAATLASGVLQFHGSWLKARWRSRDILFAKDEGGSQTVLSHPYLSRYVSDRPEDSNVTTQMERVSTALIRNEVLFPLGLALVELSLCQTLSTLRIPEDDDPNERVANFKTASRLLLERVYFESGSRYGDVVDKCLVWSGARNSNFEEENFQRTVFDTVVLPLLDDLRDFEGKSRIH